MDKRFVLYWHNGRSLGHTARSAKLGSGLLDFFQEPAVIGITGASKGLNLLPDEMDVLKLPSFISRDLDHGIKVKPVLPISLRELLYYRSKIIESFIGHFQPDAWIVDFEPQGKDGELISAIINCRAKKILGIRGIIKSPEITNKELFSKEMSSFIERHYESIHVYTDPNVIEIGEYYNIPSNLTKKIRYTGYVSNIFNGTKLESRKALDLPIDEKIIIVNFGGGDVVNKTWEVIISGLERIYPLYDKVIIVAGPYMTSDTKQHLLSLTKQYPYIRLSEMKTKFHVWMRSCDLFIGAGGYNTIADILSNNVNAVLIANQKNEIEQQIHLEKLRKGRIVRAIIDGDIDVDVAQSILCDALNNPFPTNPNRVMINGAVENAKLIDDLLK